MLIPKQNRVAVYSKLFNGIFSYITYFVHIFDCMKLCVWFKKSPLSDWREAYVCCLKLFHDLDSVIFPRFHFSTLSLKQVCKRFCFSTRSVSWFLIMILILSCVRSSCRMIDDLIAEGLLVAADEPNARKHMELENVPNLQVAFMRRTVCLTIFAASLLRHHLFILDARSSHLLVLNALHFAWICHKCFPRFLRAQHWFSALVSRGVPSRPTLKYIENFGWMWD